MAELVWAGLDLLKVYSNVNGWYRTVMPVQYYCKVESGATCRRPTRDQTIQHPSPQLWLDQYCCCVLGKLEHHLFRDLLRVL
jgi:hypothetical protein